MLPPERVLELAERLPCPLLVDEAYVDFAETNCLDLVAQSEKIMVSRTLSKSYALAGLRFGYLVAQPQLIEQFVKVKDSYNCDALAIAGATAAIDDQAWLAENRAKILATRARLTDGHARAGFCGGRFAGQFRLEHRIRSMPVKTALRELKAPADPGPIHGLCRLGGRPADFSVGTDEQIDACLALLKTMM